MVGDEQRRTIEAAKGFSDRICILGGVACDLWVVLKAAGSVLFPFLAAFAVAVLLSGAVQFIAERMHIQRGIVAVAVVLFFYIILAVFLYFAGSYLVRLIYDTARELSVFFQIRSSRSCSAFTSG